MPVTLHGPEISGASLAAGSVDSDIILDAEIVNADVSATAAIALSKLAALTSANIVVGSAANVPTAVAVSGDATLSNAGVVAIASDVIIDADVKTDAAIAYSKLAALTDGNILVGSAANVPTSVDPSGDVDVSNAGVFSIASDVIIDADVKTDAAIAYSKLAALTDANILIGSAANVATVTAVTGDVTISNAGVTAIGADKVLTTNILDANVTDAKLASSFNKDGGAQAVGYVDFTGAGADTQTVTINSRVYELDTHTAETITGDVRVNVSAGSTVKAQGTLTLNSNPGDGETVTIDGKAYTLQLVLTDVDGNVLIGGTASTTLDNLIDAINLGAGAGSDYATSMTLHPTVSAAAGAGDTMIATAKAGGTAGNSLASTETLVDAVSIWDAATLGTTTAGVDPTATECAAALATAVNADASRDVDAYNGGSGTVELIAKVAGATNWALAEALGNGVVSGAFMVDAAVAAIKTQYAITHTVTVADVTVTTDTNGTIVVAGVPSTTAPAVWLVQGRTSAGVLKALANCQFVWRQMNTNFYGLELKETQNGATDLANGDTISVFVVV